MPPRVSIESALLEQAVAAGGGMTRKDVVTRALQEFVARRRQKGLLELFGKLEWDINYDYKSERERKIP